MAWLTWRGSFIALGLVSLAWGVVWALYFRNEPRDHRGITRKNWRRCRRARRHPASGAVGAAVAPDVAGHADLFLLWLEPVAVSELAAAVLQNNYTLDIRNSALFASGVFFAGVLGDSLGGVLSDRILKKTGDIRFARLSVTVTGFAGALLSLLPILFIHDITVVALCLSAGFFFAELVIGPMWSVPMDIAPSIRARLRA